MVNPKQLPPQWQQWWLKQQEGTDSPPPDDPDAIFDEETSPVIREEDPDIEAKLDEMFGIESRPQ